MPGFYFYFYILSVGPHQCIFHCLCKYWPALLNKLIIIIIVEGDPPRKKPKQGSLPKLNMPKKTRGESSTPRRIIQRAPIEVAVQTKHCYENLQQLKKSIQNLKSLRNWTLTVADSCIILETLFRYRQPKPRSSLGIGFGARTFFA